MVKQLNGFSQPRSHERSYGAFTLIELLVVIGVIAILAGILLGVMPAAQAKSVRSRVKAEMKAVQTAIESYKAKQNFYPPGDFRDGFPNTLFYELTGTTNLPIGTELSYYSIFSPNEVLTKAQIQNIFGMDGFLNTGSAGDEGGVINFYKTLRPAQVRTNAVPASMLAAPRRGMDGQPALWHYNKSSPTNNVGEFDLWAEVELRGQKVTIGNWEK